jgi:hypothetical protein
METSWRVRRTDLFVTTALKHAPVLIDRAAALASELHAPLVTRDDRALPLLFADHLDAERALVVQTQRLLLVARTGEELFYHPNMSYLRLGNLRRGNRDLLVDAAELRPGDSVLDATLGFAAEAILCAYVVGETGTVDGIEAVPELGVVVREGLQTVVTDLAVLNAAMRRVRVVHLGHHLDFLRGCPDGRYDVVCFDPFFPEMLHESQAIGPLRVFGSHDALLSESVAEARRVARRRVVIKADRRFDMLDELGVTERFGSRGGKVEYGVIRCG